MGRGKAEDTDRVGRDVPWTLLAPWVRGGGDGVCGNDGGKKWRRLPRGVLKFKIIFDLGGVAGDSSRRAWKRPPITWDMWRGLRVPERERRVIVMRGKNREWGSDGEVEMVGDDQERWR